MRIYIACLSFNKLTKFGDVWVKVYIEFSLILIEFNRNYFLP